MIRLRHKLLIQAFRLFDQFMLVGCISTIAYLGPDLQWRGGLRALLAAEFRLKDTIGIVLLLVGWNIIFNRFVRYNSNRFNTLVSQVLDLLKATTVSAFWLLLISAACSFSMVSSQDIVIFWCASSVLGVLSRLLIRWLLMIARRSGYNYRYLLILGSNPRALHMASRINASPELGYKIVGFVTEERGQELTWKEMLDASGSNAVGCLKDIKSILEHERADELLICLPMAEHFRYITQVVRLARQLGIVARIMPEPEDANLFAKLHLELFEGDYVITLFRENLLLQLLVKRLLDMAISAVTLVILSPLFIAVAIAVKLTSPGPVFFSQERIGMNKRRFKLYKFRSMFVDAEQRKGELSHMNEMDGPVFKIKNDPRITPIGKFIRKTSIDELPQLLNVLRGHMSLVGPRPPLPQEVDQYDWLYRKRLSIKPGVTCLWQVSGRNQLSFKRWMELDREYIENWSLWLDLKILMKTVPVVLLGKGAS
jgi:exopolysaccharide biosynthesis polyprenyl glycosylphosphotransferase